MRLDLPGLVLCLVGLFAIACDSGVSFGDSGFAVGFDSGSRCDTGEGQGGKRYADIDGDGFGDADAWLSACAAPDDFVDNGLDCADGNVAVNPDAEELCGDGIDQDCDGVDPACDTAE
jgi:hypothetical protein